MYKRNIDEIIANLIENNYLNEERFAIQYAGGKFRINKWGKKKIQYELQQKSVNAYCIKKALKDLDEQDYNNTLQKLALKKWNSLTTEPPPSRAVKTHTYLLRKGFEPALVSEVISQIKSGS